jgi:hypothetical protein
MTDYHPVTKEELDMIKNDCAFPDRLDCEECKFCNTHGDMPCLFKGANALMDEVISRPDPLALLSAYISAKHMFSSGCDGHRLWIWSEPILELIERLRTNPEVVKEQGIKEGWLP